MKVLSSISHSLIKIILIFVCLLPIEVSALTYYSQAGGNFTNAIWSQMETGGGVAPAAGTHTYFIKTGHNVVMNSNITATIITVRSGGTLSITSNRQLTGTLDVLSGGTLSVANRVLTMIGNWTNSGTISGSTGGLSFSSYTGVNNNVISFSGAGSILKTGGTLTNNASGTMTFTGVATITLGTGDFVNNAANTAVNFGSGPVTITGTAAGQAIGGFRTTGLFSCTKTSGVLTLTGNVNASGLTKSGSGTLNLGVGRTHTITGTWTNTAGTIQGGSSTLRIGGSVSGTGVTFTAQTGTVDYNGSGAQSIPTLAYYNLTTSTSNTKTLIASTTVNNILTVNSGSTFATGAFTLTLAGTGTPLVDNGTFTASSGSTVIYTNATANIAPETYVNLQTSTSGTKTLAGNTTVSGVLTINSPSTLTTGANTLTLSGTGIPLVDNGTFTASAGGTVIYSNATASIAAEAYANLQTSTSGTKTLAGGTSVSGILTVNSPSTLATGANTLTLSGTGTPLVDNGTFTASAGSTVIYSGATANVAGETYVNLQTSTSGTKTLANNAIVSGILTVSSGSLDLSNRTLTLSGSGTPFVSSGTIIPSTSTVIYSGATPTIAPVSYFNLTGSAGGPKIFPAGTIGIAGTFNSAGGTYSIDNANIVNFNGTGPTQTIPAFTFKKVILSGSGQKIIATTVEVKEVDIEDGPTMDITTGQLNVN